jgi:hypothetical protein
MKSDQKIKVYLLGAGCSAPYGYPLAKEIVSHLDALGKTLGPKAGRLKACIEETVTIMRKHNVRTVDDLSFRLHHNSFEATTGSPIEDERRREGQIRAAKIATAALLLSKETSARKTGLTGYHDLLLETCPHSGGWETKLLSSNCRVLTFNYDRLFETALLSLVGPDLARKGVYEYLLNSGFSPFGDEISFKAEGFCFLKLHGSAGAQVKFRGTEAHYHPIIGGCALATEIELTDDLMFSPEERGMVRSEPLIVFPHEKHHVQSGGRHLVYERYLSAVWNKAKEMVGEAHEIHVIGYSFATMDRAPVIDLLSGASNCQRVVIQNIDGEADRLCRLLSSSTLS